MALKHKKSEKKPREKKRRSWVYWVIYVTLVAFVLFVAVKIVEQNVKIQSAREELSELQSEINYQKINLDEQKKVADAAEKDDFDSIKDNIEKKARELDYVKPGEIVFYNIAGD